MLIEGMPAPDGEFFPGEIHNDYETLGSRYLDGLISDING
jgi:hypothetical protein